MYSTFLTTLEIVFEIQKCIHLINKERHSNIERSYGLQGNRRHDNDATSVQLRVDEKTNRQRIKTQLYFTSHKEKL